MNNEYQAQLKRFTALKSKYEATQYEDSSPSSILYFILRKADLGIDITQLEADWLKEHELFNTLKAINKEQQYKVQELVNLGVEFHQLQSRYKATKYNISWKSSPLYFILWKLDSGNSLNDSEVKWLRAHGLFETNAIAQEMEKVIALKIKYKATKNKNSSPDSLLYKILKKLDTKARLTDTEVNWLTEKELFETLAIFQQQEEAREAEFSQLKAKYQATKHEDSSASPLYPILQNLDADNCLSESEMNWLKQHQLTETLNIVLEIEQKRHFAELKAKYKATQYEDSSPLSHLYKVLKKLDLGNHLSEQDINFLNKRKLTQTIAIAQEKYISTLKSKIESDNQLSESEIDWLQNNGREDIINFAQQKHFAFLKRKYGLLDPTNKLPIEPFYTIMLKLEKKERLDPVLVVQLIQQDLLSGDGRIVVAHYKLEAEFYEQEFKRTARTWHIPTASSYWRKANEPEQALQLTNLDLSTIRESKLKSAILVTRGAAFRDIGKLGNAESCARQAIEYHPGSYQPYTLMGAISYDNSKFTEGDKWFAKAIERGAKSEDIDDEIKRLVRNTKDDNKRQEVVEYLLKKDPQRYAWAKSYLKKPKDKG